MRTYRRLMGFLRPYRRQLWGSLVFAWAGDGDDGADPVAGRARGQRDRERRQARPAAARAGDRRRRRSCGSGLTVVRRLVAGKVSLAVEFDLRQRFYAHLQRLELGFFDSQQTGQLMSRATVDLQSIRFFLGYGLIFITQNLLTIVLASVVMFAINPLLALIALAPAPFVVYTASRYNRVSRPALQEVQQRIAELTAEAEENVSGIRIVKAFAREEHQLHRFRRAVARVFDQSIYSTRLQAFFSPLIGLLPQLGHRAGAAGRRPRGDRRQPQPRRLHRLLHLPGDAGRADADARRWRWGWRSGRSPRATACSRSSTASRRSRARPDAPPLPAGGGAGRAARRRRCATTAAAPGARATSTSRSRPGSTVALVGPPGSGKTSLVALIARLYDPTEGAVLVDGADVRDGRRRLAALARSPSSPTTASCSPPPSPRTSPTRARTRAARRSKRRRGAPRPTASSRACPTATRRVVGERGLTLSGGQRQRVAIARALLADPRILILDDATSSVDATTEAAIKRGLREAMAGRTTFIIAHRLSTISLADEIVVMDGGRIVDRGTHEELLERCGFYREIAEHGLADSVFLQRDLEQREEMARL